MTQFFVIIEIQGLRIDQPMKIDTSVGSFYLYSRRFIEIFNECLNIKERILTKPFEGEFEIAVRLYENPEKGNNEALLVGKEIDFSNPLDIDEFYHQVYKEYQEFFIAVNYMYTALFFIDKIYLFDEKSRNLKRICFLKNKHNHGFDDFLFRFISTKGISQLLAPFIEKIITHWDFSDDLLWILKEKVRLGYMSDKYLNYATALERVARRFLLNKGIIRIHNRKEKLINGYEQTYSQYANQSHFAYKMGMVIILAHELGLFSSQIADVIKKFYDVYNIIKHDTCNHDDIKNLQNIADDVEWMKEFEDFRILAE